MGIKAVIDADEFGELPETVQAFYSAAGDKHVLSVDGINLHPEVVNLKTAHEKVKAVVKVFKDYANGRDVDDDQITDDQAKNALSRLRARLDGLPEDFSVAMLAELKKTAEGAGAPADEQIAKIRDKYRDENKAVVTGLETKVSDLQSSIERMTIDGGLSRAMDNARIDPLHKPKLLPFLKAKMDIEVEQVDGVHKAVVNSDMGHQTLDESVLDWASSDDGKLYVAKSGGPNPNGGSGGRGGKTITRADYEKLPHGERPAAAKEMQIVD